MLKIDAPSPRYLADVGDEESALVVNLKVPLKSRGIWLNDLAPSPVFDVELPLIGFQKDTLSKVIGLRFISI
jgi:hypothetical protein